VHDRAGRARRELPGEAEVKWLPAVEVPATPPAAASAQLLAAAVAALHDEFPLVPVTEVERLVELFVRVLTPHVTSTDLLWATARGEARLALAAAAWPARAGSRLPGMRQPDDADRPDRTLRR
jgi:hypothetical protein